MSLPNMTNWTYSNSADYRTFPTVASGPAFVGWFAFSLVESILAGCVFLLLFAVFLTEKKVRSGSGILIGHYLFQQFLIGTLHFCVFTIVTFVAQHGHAIGREFCHFMQFFYWLTLFAGHYSAVFLALNRVIALCFPHAYRFWSRKKTLYFMIVLSWLLSLGINLPIYYGYGARFEPMPPFGSCGAFPVHAGFIYLILTTLGIHMPLVAVVVIYCFVFLKVFCDRQNKNHTTKNGRIRRQRVNVAKILFASAVWDCVCTFPIPLVAQWFPRFFFGSPYAQLWLRTLIYSAPVPSPVFFFAMNADYREGLRKLWTRMRYRKGTAGRISPMTATVPSSEAINNLVSTEGL